MLWVCVVCGVVWCVCVCVCGVVWIGWLVWFVHPTSRLFLFLVYLILCLLTS